MATTQVTDLNVIGLYVSDMARSEAFYRDHLGFEKTEDMPPGILMKAGELTLYLEPGRKARTRTPSDEAEFSPCFATASVKAAHDALLAADVTIVDQYAEFGPSFAFFRIADPDGNLIEFAGAP